MFRSRSSSDLHLFSDELHLTSLVSHNHDGVDGDGALDPILLSVFDDLAGRMLILPESHASQPTHAFDPIANVHAGTHHAHLATTTVSAADLAATPTCRDEDTGSDVCFLTLSEIDDDVGTVITTSASSSANSSLDSFLELDLASAHHASTSTHIHASTPVAAALFQSQTHKHAVPSVQAPFSARALSNQAHFVAAASDMAAYHASTVGSVQYAAGVSTCRSSATLKLSNSCASFVSGATAPVNTSYLTSLPPNNHESATVATSSALAAPFELPPRRYKIMQPSKFCHLCVRNAELVTLAPCANVITGVCRKAICRKCFEKHGHASEWDDAVKNHALLATELAAGPAKGPISLTGCLPSTAWTCLHCRDMCPDSAQCKIYARTNRRRHLLLKQRKEERAHSFRGRPAQTLPQQQQQRATPISSKIQKPGNLKRREQSAGHLQQCLRAPQGLLQQGVHQMGGLASKCTPT
jgi:hypothetical protein